MALRSEYHGKARLDSAHQGKGVGPWLCLANTPSENLALEWWGPPSLIADACSAGGARSKFEELRQNYHVVLFDLPAINDSAEALAIARRLDALLLVCLRDRTPLMRIRPALIQVDRVSVPVLGAVLNESRDRKAPSEVLWQAWRKGFSKWSRSHVGDRQEGEAA